MTRGDIVRAIRKVFDSKAGAPYLDASERMRLAQKAADAVLDIRLSAKSCDAIAMQWLEGRLRGESEE
jgi:hypothetical protein